MTQTQSSPLRDKLQETVGHISEIAPPELFAVFAAEQQRLAATDEPGARIAVGAKLPPTALPNAAGELVAIPGGAAVVIVFYRGAWCPYCNVALAAYQRDVLPELQRRGVALVAISPQGPDGSLTVAEQNGLAFPVLTDPAGDYARNLGIAFDLTDDVRSAQLAFGNDFAQINAGGEWALPKPTVLVVDAEGIVRFVDVQPDYTERTEPVAILDAVRAL